MIQGINDTDIERMDRFEAFIWILLRDHITVGTLADIVNNYLKTYYRFVPDSKEFMDLCKSYANKIDPKRNKTDSV